MTYDCQGHGRLQEKRFSSYRSRGNETLISFENEGELEPPYDGFFDGRLELRPMIGVAGIKKKSVATIIADFRGSAALS